MIEKLQPVPWSSTRHVLRWEAVDWFDGPLEGIVALDNPSEEFRFRAVGWPSPNGGMLRLAMAWPVPKGTIEALVQEKSPGNVGGATWTSLGDEPAGAETFFAYHTWRTTRVMGAWVSHTPIKLTDDEVDAILLTLPLDLDSGRSLP